MLWSAEAWNRVSASVYSSLSPMAFSKIDGLEVTPFSPSRSTKACRSPLAIRLRFKLSSQSDWPQAWSCFSGFMPSASWISNSAPLRYGRVVSFQVSNAGGAEPLQSLGSPELAEQAQSATAEMDGMYPTVSYFQS